MEKKFLMSIHNANIFTLQDEKQYMVMHESYMDADAVLKKLYHNKDYFVKLLNVHKPDGDLAIPDVFFLLTG